MIKTLTVQEYMELVGAEGLLIKSIKGESMYQDSIGSTPMDPEDDDEDEDEDDDEDDDEEDDDADISLVISTSDEDRVNDILNPAGCVTDNFQFNPLFLYEHGIGPSGPLTNPDSILGRIMSITMEDTRIVAIARYMPLQSNPLPGKILQMEHKGMIPGNSIGWRPLDGIELKDNGKRYIDKWELLEVSKVLVPVNGKATNRQLSA